MILVVVIALDGGFVSYEAPVDTKTNMVRTHKCFRTHMNVSGMGNSNIVQAKYKQYVYIYIAFTMKLGLMGWEQEITGLSHVLAHV